MSSQPNLNRVDPTQRNLVTEDDPTKLFRAGLHLLRGNRLQEAVAAFKRALTMAPDEAIFMSYYGLALVQTGRQYQDALNLCEDAVKRSPYHPELYHNLAQVYLIKGKRKKAIAALNRGLQLDPHYDAILDEFRRIGIRKRPPLPFLDRDHVLNIYLGRTLRLMRLR